MSADENKEIVRRVIEEAEEARPTRGMGLTAGLMGPAPP